MRKYWIKWDLTPAFCGVLPLRKGRWPGGWRLFAGPSLSPYILRSNVRCKDFLLFLFWSHEFIQFIAVYTTASNPPPKFIWGWSTSQHIILWHAGHEHNGHMPPARNGGPHRPPPHAPWSTQRGSCGPPGPFLVAGPSVVISLLESRDVFFSGGRCFEYFFEIFGFKFTRCFFIFLCSNQK